jgi:S1-C subfamily serine protease
MRALLFCLLIAIAGCDAPEEHGKLAVLEGDAGLGMSLRELPRATLQSIGLGYGLAIVRLGEAAERAGLRLGDVVYGVNQKKVESLQEFSRAIAQPGNGSISLLVRRGKTDLYVPIDNGTSGLPKRQATDTLLRT